MTLDWWTLAIQTVNVAILVWLLGRFFWRPVAAMIDQRRATAQQMLAEAEAKRSEATAALADIEHTRAGFVQEREAVLAAAEKTAEAARRARLEEASKEAAALEAAAKAEIEKDKDAADKAWAERASRLAVEIAQRLAARLDGPAIRSAFLDWLLDEIRHLPESTRQTMAASDVTLQAVSAAALEPAEQERCRTEIAATIGGHPQIVFSTDPTLIAGLELHGPHLVVSNSWHADLGQILADVAHDDWP